MALKNSVPLNGGELPFEGHEKDESAHGFDCFEDVPELYPDDGSHRLLLVPCALVILVMLLLLTACSSADGGGVDGVASVEDSISGAPVEEPEITEDGRMIQPAGHTGIWFETEPEDPLENLVYRSQKFVGHPVKLEPVGERALLPQWEDMPDPCHPEVLRRMEELGLDVIEQGEAGPGYLQCAVSPSEASDYSPFAVHGIVWASQFDIDKLISPVEPETSPSGMYEIVREGEFSEAMGCVSFYRLNEMFSVRATHGNDGSLEGCRSSDISLQAILNTIGGYNV